MEPGLPLCQCSKDKKMAFFFDCKHFHLEMTASISTFMKSHFSFSQSLEVEYMGNQPLCMRQFYNILSACRVPGVKKDSIVTFPPNEPNAPKHITVVHNNHVSASVLKSVLFHSLELFCFVWPLSLLPADCNYE